MLSEPDECPEPLWELVKSCFSEEPSKRPSFLVIRKVLEALVKEHEAESLISAARMTERTGPKSTLEQTLQSPFNRSKVATGYFLP
jgi:hypothetical protein